MGRKASIVNGVGRIRRFVHAVAQKEYETA